MACGTPVITSNNSSLPEVVERAGLLVDPEDENALGEYMTMLANDPKQRAALQNMGLNRARELSWKRCAEVTLAAYERAVRERAGR
jgi:glycosyltransferase involved in cell wall biosynthesis